MKAIFKMFRKPSAQELALAELEEAQRQLLNAQAAAEHTAAIVTYHKNRITRLRVYTTEGART